MIANMDLNVSPEPEDDEVFPEPQSKEDNPPEPFVGFHDNVEHVESAVQISRRECNERVRHIRKEHPDDKQSYGYLSTQCDYGYQAKRQRPSERLPPGWLDCPPFGQEIGCMIPSKVPLDESYNDRIPPGRRYSFRQVIQQQTVMGRKMQGLMADMPQRCLMSTVLSQ